MGEPHRSTAGRVPSASDAAELLAIDRLQRAYADVITRRAFAELGELFVPDCSVTIDTVTINTVTINTVSRDPMRFVGPDEFGSFVEAAVGRFDFFEFVILNAVVELHGDTASGRMFMCEHRHDGSEAAELGWSTAYGRYLDTYTRVDGQWRFAVRSYRSLARRGHDAAVLPAPRD